MELCKEEGLLLMLFHSSCSVSILPGPWLTRCCREHQIPTVSGFGEATLGYWDGLGEGIIKTQLLTGSLSLWRSHLRSSIPLSHSGIQLGSEEEVL